MMLSEHVVAEVKAELERRQDILIKLAHIDSSPIADVDRYEIIHYLEKGEMPPGPTDIPGLLKSFFKSGFSYAPLRNYNTSVLGEIPKPETIPYCLSIVFERPEFKDDSYWTPGKLRELAAEIQDINHFNLDSNEPKPRMVRVILDSSLELDKRLANGIDEFYRLISRSIECGPNSMWQLAVDLSKNIYNIGPALVCDFIKEIGFGEFVKVDHHFQKQFPTIVKGINCNKLSPKKHFLLSQELAQKLGITPYRLDKILYDWGRYGTYSGMLN